MVGGVDTKVRRVRETEKVGKVGKVARCIEAGRKQVASKISRQATAGTLDGSRG
jgi:hypothetical protein